MIHFLVDAEVSELTFLSSLAYFMTYNELLGFVSLCKIKVSPSILDLVKSNELDEEPSVKNIAKQIVSSLINESDVHHLHFFTLNKFKVLVKVIRDINN
jgi:5,10-methylenetetrahydrofolate reductase